MSYTTWSKGIGLLAATLAFCAPLTASAHAYIVDPPARDISNPNKDARAHKDPNGPCGKIPRKGAPKKYAPGQTITVQFEETIGHRGCYQIRFSAANDMPAVLKDWQMLAQINDPAGTTMGVQSATVTLPTTPCPACTLAVWQLMQGAAACPNNADPALAIQNTYYSCADICIGNAGDPCTTAPEPDAGAGDAGNDSGTASSSSSSGTSGTTDSGATSSSSGSDPDDTTSSSSGGTRRPTTASEDSGCAVSDSNAPGGFSLAAVIGFVGLALVRRRRGS